MQRNYRAAYTKKRGLAEEWSKRIVYASYLLERRPRRSWEFLVDYITGRIATPMLRIMLPYVMLLVISSRASLYIDIPLKQRRARFAPCAIAWARCSHGDERLYGGLFASESIAGSLAAVRR